MRAQTASLPQPRRQRWQPLRSGFVNLYRYDIEEFHYEDGRLLLRGNNGTGKSRILALQLPFLFDCETSPQRLEPDADASKKIEWNLLMDRYPERTGYTWIEFGRCEEGGSEHYLTLGCGLSAVEGQSGVRQWFFITSQRIGKDLELVSHSNHVAGKDRLREKVGAAGRVFDSAGAYRQAVNEALFGLDEYRYASLMNLLIQLRRPQLTRRLDENDLSRSLAEALPPFSRAVVASLAEAFSTLESDRSQLESSRTAFAAVDGFLTEYRRYVEVAAKRRAERVLAAHYEYETGVKEILAAEAECDGLVAELARLKAETQRLSVEEHALQSEIVAFQQNPQVNDSRALEHAHHEAAEKRKEADVAARELADATRFRSACADEHLRMRTTLARSQARRDAAIQAAVEAASAAGLEDAHRSVFSGLDAVPGDPFPLSEALEKINGAIETRMERVAHIRALNDRIAIARNLAQRAGDEGAQLSGLFDDAREALNRAREEHRAAITSFLEAASAWTADLRELPLPFDEAFLKSVAEFCDRPSGQNPFATASRKAVGDVTVAFAERRANLQHLEKMQTEEPGFETELESIVDAIEELNRRESVLRSEANAAPSDERMRAAYEYSVAVAHHVENVRKRLAESAQSVTEKQMAVDELTDKRNQAAVDLGITAWAQNVDTLKSALSEYRAALSGLSSAVESSFELRTAFDLIWMHLEEATAREARQKEIYDELERRATAAEIARDAAGRAAGEDIAETLQRVARARERLEQMRIEEKELRTRYHDTEVAVTRVDERLRNRTEMLNGQTDRRESAAASLLTFVSTGLLRLAAAGLDNADDLASSTTRTVELAFELKSRLDPVDASDSVWETHQKAIPSAFNRLMQILSAQECRSSAVFRDDVFVATAAFAGKERPVHELQAVLFEDVETRQRLLRAREREILENHLIGHVSHHLHDLLHAAEEQVRQMNAELESRPMSTGMKLRFVWRPVEHGPEGLAEARQRLMQPDSEWTAAERQMLGAFFQRQIHDVCSGIEGASWQESLAEALDYRRWHWFGVERYQDGVWKRLTRRTHGTGSGGEKAVALTLPHFAAAAAFYRSAQPLAPRLILLDEAFVGIDADMRAKCMGLIDAFDLDFMMTSEREWGCYQTLPALAIYQLSTRPGIDAVGLTRWVWNGRQRSLANPPSICHTPQQKAEQENLCAANLLT